MAEHEQYYLSQHDTHLILGQLRCVLEESPIRQAAREDLLHIMRDLGATSDHAGQIADKILQQFDGVFRGELSLFDAEKALHRSFSDIAITHGGEPTTVMNRLNAVFEERIETIVKQLSPVMIPLSALDGKILDIGSGNGKLARHLEKEFGVSILGYDLIGTPRSENNVEVRAYDGQHIPETDKAFKAVLMINLLHHVEDPNVLLK
ncbi:MAG: class I SAM-dependent methyltransferase, partial [Rickettsiales bacterium]|nr:class I SAM-dependent methyltransferase [Rickettsiales bacterium]